MLFTDRAEHRPDQARSEEVRGRRTVYVGCPVAWINHQLRLSPHVCGECRREDGEEEREQRLQPEAYRGTLRALLAVFLCWLLWG